MSNRGPQGNAPIPRNYLSREGGQWLPVKLLDICTLLVNVYNANKREDIGFQDANRSLEQLTAMLNKKVLLSPSVIESCLWSCNMMNEEGQFWDSKGRTLEEYVKYILGSDRFNYTYNVIERKDA